VVAMVGYSGNLMEARKLQIFLHSWHIISSIFT